MFAGAAEAQAGLASCSQETLAWDAKYRFSIIHAAISVFRNVTNPD